MFIFVRIFPQSQSGAKILEGFIIDWLNGVVVSGPDYRAEGRGFDSHIKPTLCDEQVCLLFVWQFIIYICIYLILYKYVYQYLVPVKLLSDYAIL